MTFTTASLADKFANEIDVAEPILNTYGGAPAFWGQIVTLDVFEDHGLLTETLKRPGQGKVLVVDGGGSVHRALLGQELAQVACDNGWHGVILYGCVRHVTHLAQIPMGIVALAATPIPAWRRGRGSSGKPIHFAGITFREGQFVYADADGVIIAARNLLARAQ